MSIRTMREKPSSVIIFTSMDLKHRSHGITDGRDRAPARAMFKAIGFTDEDLSQADHRRG